MVVLHACVLSSFFLYFFLNFTFFEKYFKIIRYTICLDPVKIPYFAVSDLGPFCLGETDNLALATLARALIRGICACAISSNMGVY